MSQPKRHYCHGTTLSHSPQLLLFHFMLAFSAVHLKNVHLFQLWTKSIKNSAKLYCSQPTLLTSKCIILLTSHNKKAETLKYLSNCICGPVHSIEWKWRFNHFQEAMLSKLKAFGIFPLNVRFYNILKYKTLLHISKAI